MVLAHLNDEGELENVPIWGPFCAALGAEHRDAKEIVGASGLVHPVEAIGIDEVGKRLIVVSAESNPRVAAMLRGDVQATMPDLRVLVARPTAIDIAHVVRSVFFSDAGVIDLEKLMTFGKMFKQQETANEELVVMLGDPIHHMLETVKRSPMLTKFHIFNVLEQLYEISWDFESILQDGGALQSLNNTLTQFSRLDTLAGDREQGICPIPTYEFTEEDWMLFASNGDREEIQSRLKDLEIFQYFFPPADSLALGLVDRGIVRSEGLQSGFDLAQAQGHEISENSLISDVHRLPDIVDELKSRGYLADGEFSMEVAGDGKTIRQNIRFRPSEGLISKIARLISVKVNITGKDFMDKG